MTWRGALQPERTLVDVRETAEYVAGHVPGALHMPMGQLPLASTSWTCEHRSTSSAPRATGARP